MRPYWTKYVTADTRALIWVLPTLPRTLTLTLTLTLILTLTLTLTLTLSNPNRT